MYSISKVFERGNDEGHVSSHPMIRPSDLEVIYQTDEMLSSADSPDMSEEVIDIAPDISYDSYTMYKVNMTNSFSDEAKLVDASEGKQITQQKGQEYRDTGHLERRALLSLFEQSLVSATIPFRSDLTVGTVVSLQLPSPELKVDSSSNDKMLDGRYLIGKMTYSIDVFGGKGTITMQGIKESYGVNVKEYKPLEEDMVGPKAVSYTHLTLPTKA